MERIDKILSNLGYGTRKEVKGMMKKGVVEIDGKIIKDSGFSIDPEKCEIKVKGEVVQYRKYIYLMMNKPSGVVSATFDNYDETVIDLLEEEHKNFEPFPVGRLDKDTVGLLFITNDGDVNHRMISPKWHVDKVYYAEINKTVDESDILAFEEGIVLDDGYKCMPAKLEILHADADGSQVNITIQEGKFHQVKRMFQSRNKTVVYLRRMRFGPLLLDEALAEGKYREMSKEEIEAVKKI